MILFAIIALGEKAGSLFHFIMAFPAPFDFLCQDKAEDIINVSRIQYRHYHTTTKYTQQFKRSEQWIHFTTHHFLSTQSIYNRHLQQKCTEYTFHRTTKQAFTVQQKSLYLLSRSNTNRISSTKVFLPLVTGGLVRGGLQFGEL